MTENIKKLLNLFEHGRTTIKRVEFENPDHLAFVNEILVAVKDAAPEIRVLSLVNQKTDSILEGLQAIHYLAAQTARAVVTTLHPDDARAASNDVSPVPETERNTHTLTETQSTAGTAEAPDHKEDNGGKPEASPATLTAARKAAATSRVPSEPKPKGTGNGRRAAAPQRSQSSIP